MNVSKNYFVLFLFCTVFTFAGLVSAQQVDQAAIDKANAEIKAAFGFVPEFLNVFPDHFRPAIWEWMKPHNAMDNAIPPKYQELIRMAVAAQIPCDYCTYAHKAQAQLLGATDAEIKEAMASAGFVRYWSTMMNGSEYDLEKFKKEWDQLLENVSKMAQEK